MRRTKEARSAQLRRAEVASALFVRICLMGAAPPLVAKLQVHDPRIVQCLELVKFSKSPQPPTRCVGRLGS